MMENAAAALEKECAAHVFDSRSLYLARPLVLILAGGGNNGADGYALARRMVSHDCAVYVCQVMPEKSSMCMIQKERAEKCGVHFISFYDLDEFLENKTFDLRVIVDCIFGSGFHGQLPAEAEAVIQQVNKEICFKLACDIPSGLDGEGNSSGTVFNADCTVTMGALKLALFSDEAKDRCGKILKCNLGVAANNFEPEECDAFLLEECDMKLPFRSRQNVNKGSFGHTAVVAGNKKGAPLIAAQAALNFGSGLVTVTGEGMDSSDIPFEIMSSPQLPENTTAVAVGMGLGDSPAFLEEILDRKIPCVLDADILYRKELPAFLEAATAAGIPLVLTPHPKEFAGLLKACSLGDFTTQEAVRRRYELAELFCKKYPGAVLLVKGANSLICQKNARGEFKMYLNASGTSALAKGGSGDVLAGMAAALLAQGSHALGAAIHASLAHSIAGSTFKDSFALTPMKLINAVAALGNKTKNY